MTASTIMRMSSLHFMTFICEDELVLMSKRRAIKRERGGPGELYLQGSGKLKALRG